MVNWQSEDINGSTDLIHRGWGLNVTDQDVLDYVLTLQHSKELAFSTAVFEISRSSDERVSVSVYRPKVPVSGQIYYFACENPVTTNETELLGWRGVPSYHHPGNNSLIEKVTAASTFLFCASHVSVLLKTKGPDSGGGGGEDFFHQWVSAITLISFAILFLLITIYFVVRNMKKLGDSRGSGQSSRSGGRGKQVRKGFGVFGKSGKANMSKSSFYNLDADETGSIETISTADLESINITKPNASVTRTSTATGARPLIVYAHEIPDLLSHPGFKQ